MTGQGNGTGRDVFRELWQRWTEVVRQFALRRRSRRWLSEREYHALRQSLLEACRSLAGTADGEARALYERLESVAEPWLTLYALERAEREVLFDLFQGCRQVGRELGGHLEFPGPRLGRSRAGTGGVCRQCDPAGPDRSQGVGSSVGAGAGWGSNPLLGPDAAERNCLVVGRLRPRDPARRLAGIPCPPF